MEGIATPQSHVAWRVEGISLESSGVRHGLRSPLLCEYPAYSVWSNDDARGIHVALNMSLLL